MDTVRFPYTDAMDALEEVGAVDSFSRSLDLTRQGIVCGPSSGFTLHGLLQMLGRRIESGTLSELAGPDGEVNCVFICSDLPYQYINEYFDKLGPEKFAPVHNDQLRNYDKYPYHDAWERPAPAALSSYFTVHPLHQSSSDPVPLATATPEELARALSPRPNVQVLDFRRAADHAAFLTLPGAVSMPLESLRAGAASGSPFADPVGDVSMLQRVWTELEGLFDPNSTAGQALLAMLRGKKVLTLCYDGDSARVANSVLRAKGIEADSVRGGVAALAAVMLPCSGDAAGISSTVDPVGA